MRTARSQDTPDEVVCLKSCAICVLHQLNVRVTASLGPRTFGFAQTLVFVCFIILPYLCFCFILLYIFVWRESWYLRTLTPVGVVVSPRSGS